MFSLVVHVCNHHSLCLIKFVVAGEGPQDFESTGLMSFGWRSGFLFHGILQPYDKTPEYDLVNVSIEQFERSRRFLEHNALYSIGRDDGIAYQSYPCIYELYIV